MHQATPAIATSPKHALIAKKPAGLMPDRLLIMLFLKPKPLCADKRLQRGQEAGHIAPAHEQRDADEDDAADVGERMVAPLAKALAVGDVHHEERHDG